MRDNKYTDASRPRPKKKSKKTPPTAPSRGRLALFLALFAGAGVAGLLVIGLVIWGLVALFAGGDAIAARARPADIQLPVETLPMEEVPTASPGWNVTPDALPLASGLTSAVPLPDGTVAAVLFSDPAHARSAVVMAKPPLPPGPGVVVRNKPTYPLEWAQVDLTGGRVVAQTSLGNCQVGANAPFGRPPVSNAALSPSGDRLAIVVATDPALLQVWDKTGKKLMELKETDFPGPRAPRAELIPGRDWLAFLSESRLLMLGGDKLIAVDVPSGTAAYATSGVKAPVALSPGRKWVCAAALTDGLKFFNTADGALAGEIPKYGKPTAAAFSPDGTAIAVSFGSVVVWDVVTGKPTRGLVIPKDTVYDRTRLWDSIGWFGGKHLLVRSILFDTERDLGVCEYDYRPLVVSPTASPDGRLWAAGSYEGALKAGVLGVKVSPGPIVDAGAKGTKLLTAYTIPHDDAKRRLEAGLNGITFRAGKPVRIEVTGKGSAAAKQQLADAAAEEAAKRGIAVDPAAKIGVRIDLAAAKRVTIAYNSPDAPGSLIPKESSKLDRPGYRVEASVYLINRENGSVSKAPSVFSGHAPVGDPNWEADILTGIGKQVGSQHIPIAGYYNSAGEGAGFMKTASLGIDGVLEPNQSR